ncbi:MAG: hypothetical protein ACOCV1_00065 [Bacillota bacterium]
MAKVKRFSKSLKVALGTGAAAVFGVMIVQGALALFPEITGITLIIIGIIGLSLLTYFNFKK